jgi:hypothetical protein
MSSPDHLATLLRQRALISQHLAWLDAEIAAHTPGSAATPPPPPTPASLAVAVATPASAASLTEPIPAATAADTEFPDPLAEANSRADEIINRYRSAEALNPADTKRSCLLLMAAVLLFSTAIIIGVYLLRYR